LEAETVLLLASASKQQNIATSKTGVTWACGWLFGSLGLLPHPTLGNLMPFCPFLQPKLACRSAKLDAPYCPGVCGLLVYAQPLPVSSLQICQGGFQEYIRLGIQAHKFTGIHTPKRCNGVSSPKIEK